MQRLFRAGVLAALCVVMPAAAIAAPVDNPLLRSFYWFRFVGGDDIKKACAAGAPDIYRLIYNATWREQVRAYDVETRPDGTANLTIRILGPAVINSVEISEPSGILNPWRGLRTRVELSRDQLGALKSAIESSGGFAFPSRKFELPSNDFYWAVSACHNGQFTSTAYLYEVDRFKAVKFDKLLFGFDNSGAPVNPVKDLPPSSLRGDQNQVWRLRVGPDGIQY